MLLACVLSLASPRVPLTTALQPTAGAAAHVEFLEIGLSDCNTAAQLTNDTGLSPCTLTASQTAQG